jgi:transposase
MFYLGVDYHKAYSHVVAIDEDGKERLSYKVSNTNDAFKELLKQLNGSCRAVIECGRTWGVIYDLLESLGVDVKLANPLKVRAIAEAKIKTDSIDARTLAELLRANLIPEVHIPSREVRKLKNIIRHRMWLVKLRTMTKNRIHQVIDRNHIENPGYSDIFGKNGRKFLNTLELEDPDKELLDKHLGTLDFFNSDIKDTEQWIEKTLKDNPLVHILKSVPGFGKTLSAMVALEVDDITRFPTSKKFCGYCGLIPSTRSSGGFTFHGDLIKTCNHWLRYAFVEAAWKSIISSPYCRSYFYRIKERKGNNIAVVAMARRLAEIVYSCLKGARNYEEHPYSYCFQHN